jgi:hypothetical protein
MAKVKGKETHITIKSTQLNPNHHNHHQTNKQVTQKTKANQTSFENTHTQLLLSFFSVTVGSTFVPPFQ